jgi:hypothetical protein
VVTALFGCLSNSLLRAMNCTTKTWVNGMRRVEEVITDDVRAKFTDNDREDGFVLACVCQDASHKHGSDYVVKPFTVECRDGHVRQLQLKTDITGTKKSGTGAIITIESITAEVTQGAIWKITSGTCDVFGKAELKKVLQEIDKLVVALEVGGKDMTIRSQRIEGLMYDYGGACRAERLLSCEMHAFERVLKPLFILMIGKQGLSSSATTAQCIYSIAYYMKKYKDSLIALNIVSAEGDILDRNVANAVPAEMRRLLKKICATRWESCEYTCTELIAMLNVVADKELLAFVEATYQGEMEQLPALLDLMVCPDSDEPSYLIISFFYLSNHAAGGISGEGYIRLHDLVGMMCSPYHRCCLFVIKELYPMHRKWTKFADGKSKTRPSEMVETISTRAIELSTFQRNCLQDIMAIQHNWMTALPKVFEYVKKEAKRAVSLYEKSKELFDKVTEKEFFEDIEKELKIGIEGTVEKAKKYFVDRHMNLGTCILYITDPHVGPHVAFAILKAFEDNGWIKSDNEGEPMNLTPPPSTAEGAEPRAHEPWTQSCPVYVFPRMKNSEFQGKIKKLFTLNGSSTAKRASIDGIVRAYGLRFKQVLEELKMLSTNVFLNHLKSSADWSPGVPVHKYWVSFQEMFPALADVLDTNFGHVLIASTIAEIMFSWINTQGHANSNPASINRNMTYKGVVRGDYNRKKQAAEPLPQDYDSDEEESVQEAFKYRQSKRSEPTLDDINAYLRELVRRGEEMQASSPYTSSSRTLALRHSKDTENKLRQNYKIAEFQSNAKRGNNSHNLKDTMQIVHTLNKTWLEKVDKLPPRELHPYTAYSVSTEWNVEAKRNYLASEENINLTAKELKSIHLRVNRTDPDDYISIQQMLVMHWEEINLPFNQLQAIVDRNIVINSTNNTTTT